VLNAAENNGCIIHTLFGKIQKPPKGVISGKILKLPAWAVFCIQSSECKQLRETNSESAYYQEFSRKRVKRKSLSLCIKS